MEILKYSKNQEITLIVNDEPFFRGKEIATILGYKDTQDAIQKHVDEDDVFTWEEISVDLPDDIPKTFVKNTKFINESGLYSLILRSKLPEANKFKKWVTSEVLPSIRKTGKYDIITPERKLALINNGIDMLKKIGPLEERDQIFLKGEIRNILLFEKTGNDGKRREVPITDRITQLGFRYKSSDREKLIKIGRELRQKYEQVHGEKPHKREQYVEGTTRMVYCYNEDDFPLMDVIIKKYYQN